MTKNLVKLFLRTFRSMNKAKVQVSFIFICLKISNSCLYSRKKTSGKIIFLSFKITQYTFKKVNDAKFTVQQAFNI